MYQDGAIVGWPKGRWPKHSFSPWIGCTRVSPGCQNCHERMGPLPLDLALDSVTRTPVAESNWGNPRDWNRKGMKAAQKIRAVCGALCDWADDAAPTMLRDRMWAMLRDTPYVDWLLITKRSENISKFLPSDWGPGYPNVWLGVSVENIAHGMRRIIDLRKIPAKVRFICLEPLMEDPGILDLAGIHWVVLGGEIGRNARPLKAGWISEVHRQCELKGIPFLFKNWSSATPAAERKKIDISELREWPYSTDIPKEGPDSNFFNRPKSRINRAKKIGDTQFWFVVDGRSKMESWRKLAAEWFAGQVRARENKRIALDRFLVGFIWQKKLPTDPYKFLSRRLHMAGDLELPLFSESPVVKQLSEETKCQSCNYIHEFLQWVLENKLSVEDDYGRPIVAPEYCNPVAKIRRSGKSSTLHETNKPALPYQYIRELKGMLCQGIHFRDWITAHGGTTGDGLNSGDWFEVDRERIDMDDPDCVWRQTPNLGRKTYEMWCPVRAVAIYIKLELPLRTFQVRMLDSGEADTWSFSAGKWIENHSPIARGSIARPYQKGVFHRSVELVSKEVMTGFYINTNKTADINKTENARGYVIPWQNDAALFWLEKLRNWQAKYNPCSTPIAWSSLTERHFGRTPPHNSILEEMGDACFLFRDPLERDPEDRLRPISPHALHVAWNKLLMELEKRCKARGEKLNNGDPIEFVYESKSGIHPIYPLHSLRVSLITAYALDGGVPFQVLSKLIVGHSRLIMTLYYTKLGKAHVTEIMADAELSIKSKEQESYRRFLSEAEYLKLEKNVAYNDPVALHAAVQAAPGGVSLIVEDRGVCTVGGTRCNEGGELYDSAKKHYGPTPGYPAQRNCTRCRFFLTGPAFLPGLIAHFNVISFNLSECAKKYVDLEIQVRSLEDRRYEAEKQHAIFDQFAQLSRLNQLYEECAERANGLAHDLNASYRLIHRCTELLEIESEGKNKLIASSAMSHVSIGLQEEVSEMHQLEIICENSVVFQGCDERSATLRRSQVLDAMLQLNGKKPVFFRLSEEQQLLVGNELMRLLRARTGSFQDAVEIAEGKRSLVEIGLLEEALSLLQKRVQEASLEDSEGKYKIVNSKSPAMNEVGED